MNFWLVASNPLSLLKWNWTNNYHNLVQPRTENMSYPALLEYLHSLSIIYFKSSRKKKSQLLDDAVEITEQHRKSLIRTLNSCNQSTNNKKSNCGAKIKYPEELLLPHIKFLWIKMDRMSSRKMKAALREWLPDYHENNVDSQVKFLLDKMSVSTLGRFLKRLRKLDAPAQKGLCSTVPARTMQNKVPINTLDSKVTRPGYVQVDTVAHCGDRLEGMFMNSLTFTDVYSAWTENRAIFTKKGMEVKKSLNDIDSRIPFSLIAINSDSGSEFLNMPVFNMFKKKKVIFTRSRPYKKNDNCYVEQKNFTHVRELFGYQRFENDELTTLMNEIYRDYWNPLQNFFHPTFKLKEKIRIGARIKKKYDRPQTPYQRLMESDSLTEVQKINLSLKRKSLNPFTLKSGLEKKLADFFKLVNEYNKKKELTK